MPNETYTISLDLAEDRDHTVVTVIRRNEGGYTCVKNLVGETAEEFYKSLEGHIIPVISGKIGF